MVRCPVCGFDYCESDLRSVSATLICWRRFKLAHHPRHIPGCLVDERRGGRQPQDGMPGPDRPGMGLGADGTDPPAVGTKDARCTCQGIDSCCPVHIEALRERDGGTFRHERDTSEGIRCSHCKQLAHYRVAAGHRWADHCVYCGVGLPAERRDNAPLGTVCLE